MFEPSTQCSDKAHAGQVRMFLCYGALAIALAVGFGYSMASINYQHDFVEVAKISEKERDSLHRRYTRQLNAKDKEIAQLREAGKK